MPSVSDFLNYRFCPVNRDMVIIHICHPYVVRLLKGIFNSRPPVSKLLPEWDLPRVLKMLEKLPFEPIKKAKLKHVTMKIVFLIAITTFRRCSDLQSLRIGDGSVSVQKKGVTFIRHGLAKQDRPFHFDTKVFVPSFAENKLLDPKRALFYYLECTESFRHDTEGKDETKLFLSTNEPHKLVSSQTISSWLVKTIKMAHDKDWSLYTISWNLVGPLQWCIHEEYS